jgi:putative membrane protein
VALAAVLALGTAPALVAQESNGPVPPDNARTTNSTADQHADQNGSSASQPGTLQKNDSKDGSTETRDANPSQASTPGAVDKSATKDTPSTEASSSTPTHHHHSSDKMTDKEFMMKAAQGGMTEVEASKLAGDKASSDKVKEFASKMVEDHTKANDELKGIASSKNVMLPEKLDSMHQMKVDKLSKSSGADFDKAYVKAMVMDHEKTVAMFKEEASSGTDPDVKGFASKTLPVIEDHLMMIKQISASMK